MSSDSKQPSLVEGHAKYAKGVVETAIGDATGSHPWKTSGEQDKAAGQAEMASAGDRREGQGFGKAEEVAGKVTGCEGMQKEGAASKKD